MYQFTAAKAHVGAAVNPAPNLHGAAAAASESKDATGEEAAAAEAGTEGVGAAKVSAPACDWTLPFPVSASATTDDGNLLALGMTDGTVVLYNMRLAAVARTMDRLGGVVAG